VDSDAIIRTWTASGKPGPLFPGMLRLARQVPEARRYLDQVLEDPMDRALAGVGPPPDDQTTLEGRVLSALAAADGGTLPPAATAAALERDAEGDALWWVHAARIHVLADVTRERAARGRLADQSLPYVFPGEIHPLMVDLLAAADRVLPALHVDWVRKLTKWMSDDLIREDCVRLALWFWPVLGSLDPGRLVRPLARLSDMHSLPPGALGMAAAYCHRVGTPGDLMLAKSGPVDRLVMALALAGLQRRNDPSG